MLFEKMNPFKRRTADDSKFTIDPKDFTGEGQRKHRADSGEHQGRTDFRGPHPASATNLPETGEEGFAPQEQVDEDFETRLVEGIDGEQDISTDNKSMEAAGFTNEEIERHHERQRKGKETDVLRNPGSVKPKSDMESGPVLTSLNREK